MLPRIQTICYAAGLGTGAPLVFRYALSLAQQYQAKIAVVHALEPVSLTAQVMLEQHMSREKLQEMQRQARSRIAEELEEFCRRELREDPQGRSRVSAIEVVDGPAAQVILDEAKKRGADLIVMGTHRHTAVGEALLGSTAHKVLHGATVPVLAVRDTGR